MLYHNFLTKERRLTWFNGVEQFYSLNICNTNFLKCINVKSRQSFTN